MKSLHHFIVCIPEPYQDHLVTEKGVKIFIDRRWTKDKSVTRVGTVVSMPINFNTQIKEGFQVAVDPTILYEQTFHLTHGNQDSVFLVDKTKRYYKISPSMIVLFRENENVEWKGNMNNSLFQLVKSEEKEEEKLTSSFIIIPDNAKPKFEKNIAQLVYGNDDLLSEMEQTDKAYVNEQYGITFPLDGKEYVWYKNEDVLGVITN